MKLPDSFYSYVKKNLIALNRFLEDDGLNTNDVERLLRRIGLDSLEDRQLVKQLGSGGQGTVCVYSDKNKNKVAVKFLICPRGEDDKQRFINEAKALKKCQRFGNTIIAALSEVKQYDNLPVYYFLLELAAGETLKSLMDRNPPPWDWDRCLKSLYRIAAALSPAHLAYQVHRDLHPGNIFFDEDKFHFDRQGDETQIGVSIIDLGVAAETPPIPELLDPHRNEVKTFRPVGSVKYASPEALSTPESVKPSSDIFSLGTIFYLLLTGKLPFHANTLSELIAQKKEGAYPAIARSDLSQEQLDFAKILLSSMLSAEPSKRLSIAGITKMTSDALFYKLPTKIKDNDFLWQYVIAQGDMWICLRCRQTVHPDGSMCPACGQRADEWLHWNF